jgi:hypothetical protein
MAYECSVTGGSPGEEGGKPGASLRFVRGLYRRGWRETRQARFDEKDGRRTTAPALLRDMCPL